MIKKFPLVEHVLKHLAAIPKQSSDRPLTARSISSGHPEAPATSMAFVDFGLPMKMIYNWLKDGSTPLRVIALFLAKAEVQIQSSPRPGVI